MANTNLTSDIITREALRILHQKCNFVTNINTQYDNKFAQDGAKIGDYLDLRRPVEYLTSTGQTMKTGTASLIDSVEQKFRLQVSTQRHVDLRFSSAELTMDIDDFSNRHIKPAMSRMAAAIENDALSMLSGVATAAAVKQKGIYNSVLAGTKVELIDVLNGRKQLQDNLAPTSDCVALLDTQANVDLVNELKGLFHDSSAVKKQYKEGMMGRTAGYDFYENTLMPSVTFGTSGGTNAYLVKGANQSSTDADIQSLIIDTGTKTILAGQTFTIENTGGTADAVLRVHPESKASTGAGQIFTVVGPATASGSTTLVISPGVVVSGPRKNCSAKPPDNGKLQFTGAASTTYKQSVLFHPDAFVFGSADLVMPSDVDFKSRQNFEGISMRLLRQYDVVKDNIYCRLDVLYGYRTLYRQLACRLLHT